VTWTDDNCGELMVFIDESGRVQIDVDDDHYSGRLSRDDSVALARAILDWKPVKLEELEEQ